MSTTVHPILATMKARASMVRAGSSARARPDLRDQIVKSTSTNVTRLRAAVVQLVKIKSTALNVSARQESLEIVAKVRV